MKTSGCCARSAPAARRPSRTGCPAGAVIAGGLAAGVASAALSPLTLFGPVRGVEAGHGLYADWAVLGLGAVALVAVLGAAAVLLSYRQAPHRVAGAPRDHGSALVRAAAIRPVTVRHRGAALRPGTGAGDGPRCRSGRSSPARRRP